MRRIVLYVLRSTAGSVLLLAALTSAGCTTPDVLAPLTESRLEREVAAEVANDPFPSAAESGIKTR
jgi:hypothetical protein